MITYLILTIVGAAAVAVAWEWIDGGKVWRDPDRDATACELPRDYFDEADTQEMPCAPEFDDVDRLILEKEMGPGR